MCYLRHIKQKSKSKHSIDQILEEKASKTNNDLLGLLPNNDIISTLLQIGPCQNQIKMLLIQMLAVLTLISLSLMSIATGESKDNNGQKTGLLIFLVFGGSVLLGSLFTFCSGNGQKIGCETNLLIILSIALLLAFDTLISPPSDHLNPLTEQKLFLFLFILLTNLLDSVFLRILSHLARAALKIGLSYVIDADHSTEFKISETSFELFFLIISTLIIFATRRTKSQSKVSERFLVQIEFLRQLFMHNSFIPLAVINTSNPFQLMCSTQAFMQLFNLSQDEPDCLKKIEKKMGPLTRKTLQSMGTLQKVLETVSAYPVTSEQLSTFHFAMGPDEINPTSRVFQGKIAKIAGFLVLSVENFGDWANFGELKADNEFRKRVFTCLEHELKTPLNGSLPMLEEVLTGTSHSFDSGTRKLIEYAVLSLKVLQNSVGMFCDYSQLLSKQLVLNIAEFNLSDLLSSIESILTPLALEKSLEFSIQVDASVPALIHSDHRRLQQVLLSLLQNSLKFTSAGSITLIIEQINPGVIRFKIQDTGQGIPLEQRLFLQQALANKIIQTDPKYPFQGLLMAHKLTYKLAPSLEKSQKGIIISSMKQLNGASVSFVIENKTSPNSSPLYRSRRIRNASASTSLVLGSKFQLPILPCSDLIKEGSCGETDVFDEPGISTLVYSNHLIVPEVSADPEVLCVDDDPFNLLTLELMLGKMNIHCVKAFNGAQALEIVKKKRFTLILMDYAMPVLDGIQTTKRLRGMMNKKEIAEAPIVGCSAFSSKAETFDCLNAGMKDVLTKPVHHEDLRKIIVSLGYNQPK